ncbi:MAG: methylthioadenosine phosphorylase [Omnitrophica WOR_2 bacterium RIFCSPLOWO2_12_FULL_46_30]|nr:MAG: methylthioadenosine phosphorylase [Omnitrophica WOR_2 bacterium RIFCSPHIGHO2_02_FULL_46_37]OGX44356.1 MAG: methylthioadenosine phosphorylase [Omnitrophica WOR_2 bacterium RIFCSPLOWO2_02_FULL_45_28]OGX50600.1 MAG: methylthioadenosine phosphorylase [Omnitrophica WOR_2 bacterium RIFCSPLOWO2_12_FULL_46_30]
MAKIGIIGGSGLYDIEGIKNVRRIIVETPFGRPSDKYITGELGGRQVVFLPRHGVGHRISPSEINYRANIYGMKKLGAERIISLSACGSLKEGLRPLDFVIPDQFVDRTNQARKMTFFEKGIVAHISFARPVCAELAKSVYEAAKKSDVTAHLGGTYINMEGPAFSTRAESELYRKWGMDIIGMTNMAEAKLAREAELCYSTLAAVTDYDCWYESEEAVTVEMVIANLNKNIQNAKNILKNLIPSLSDKRGCACCYALKDAVITDKKRIPKKVKEGLKIIIGKYL